VEGLVGGSDQSFLEGDVSDIMIEYAEYYARQLWADILDASYYDDNGVLIFQPTSLTLPEHK
jgi:hypothetical protein